MSHLHSCLIPLLMLMYSIIDTLTFPDLLKNAEEVKSLFTSIPVKETNDYIIQKIYIKK